MRNRPRTAETLKYGGRKARRQVDQAHNTSAPINTTDTARDARDAALRFRDNRWSDSQGY